MNWANISKSTIDQIDIPDANGKAAWSLAKRKNREAIEYQAANPQALDETEDTTHLFDV